MHQQPSWCTIYTRRDTGTNYIVKTSITLLTTKSIISQIGSLKRMLRTYRIWVGCGRETGLGDITVESALYLDCVSARSEIWVDPVLSRDDVVASRGGDLHDFTAVARGVGAGADGFLVVFYSRFEPLNPWVKSTQHRSNRWNIVRIQIGILNHKTAGNQLLKVNLTRVVDDGAYLGPLCPRHHHLKGYALCAQIQRSCNQHSDRGPWLDLDRQEDPGVPFCPLDRVYRLGLRKTRN